MRTRKGSEHQKALSAARSQYLNEAHAADELAAALLRLADDAGMPDSFWATDSRVAKARERFGLGPDERGRVSSVTVYF